MCDHATGTLAKKNVEKIFFLAFRNWGFCDKTCKAETLPSKLQELKLDVNYKTKCGNLSQTILTISSFLEGGGRPRMPGAAEQQSQLGEQQLNKKNIWETTFYLIFQAGEDQRGPGALRREEKLPAKLPRLHQDKDGRKGTYINELSSQYRHGIPGHAGGQGYDPPSPSLRMPL